jgi:hypothetical protein
MQNLTGLPVYQAILLNQESHILAKGTARLYTSQPCGEFFPVPQVALSLDILKTAQSLKISTGECYQISNLLLCPTKNKPLHYDFDYS